MSAAPAHRSILSASLYRYAELRQCSSYWRGAVRKLHLNSPGPQQLGTAHSYVNSTITSSSRPMAAEGTGPCLTGMPPRLLNKPCHPSDRSASQRLLRATKRRIASMYAARNGKAGSIHTHTHTAETEACEALALELLRQRQRLSMITTPCCQMQQSQGLVSFTHRNKRASLDDVKECELSSGSAGGGVPGVPESAGGCCGVGSVVSAAIPQGLAAVATLAQACTDTGTGQRLPSHLLTLGPGAGA